MMRTNLGAFASGSFRLLWCSSLASAGAQWMERVATGWLALETSGGPLGVGAVQAARMLPALLFGLVSGTIADRADRRHLLIAVAGAGAMLALMLGMLVRVGAIAFWHVLAIAFLAGAIQVSDLPARQALVLDTVGRGAELNGIALNTVASRLFGAVGALVGGVLIPTLGVATCYALVAASYLLSLLFIGVLVTPARALPTLQPSSSFRNALIEAVRLIRERPAVRTLAIAAMTCEIFGFSYTSAMPVVARDVLHAGAEGLGILTAAASFGATAAMLVLAWLPGSVRREPLLASVFALYGLALLAFALAPGLAAAVAAMLVVGSAAAVFDTLQQTLVQLAVPTDRRGRAMGIWVLSIGVAPIGHLEMGTLATVVGAPMALAVNGLLVLGGALVLVARAPAYRWQSVSLDVDAGR